jgi:hypothetical protein
MSTGRHRYIHALVYHERKRAEHTELRQQIEASVRTDLHRREVSTMGKTIAEELMQEGRKQGRKQEAITSRRRILLKQLHTRFGALPEHTVSAIESCTSLAQLDTWLEKFATAATLDEIGIGA